MFPPTVAAAVMVSRESDRARAAEYARRARRARPHETEPTRRRRAVRAWARVSRATAEPA